MAGTLKRSCVLFALAGALLAEAAGTARADFSGTPVTVKVNGGWCWFQDPRAVIVNGQLLIGTVAGTTSAAVNGQVPVTQTAGNIAVTSFDLSTRTAATPVLLKSTASGSQFGPDDHNAPAFAPLPDGRVLVTYESHGGDNDVYWRVGSSSAGGGPFTWSTETASVMNTTNDGNGNTYNNPFYLSTPNFVFNSSRAIGYDPNYATFTNVGAAKPTFNYGGHWMYWKNPSNSGNGRPYVKYASNGTDTVWFATTEDSPDNYNNSLYVGYTKFNAAGAGTVYTSTGAALGAISTGTTPGTSTGGTGPVASGSGFSYSPTAFTPVLQANSAANGMTGKAVSWASSMQLDRSGNPYMGVVVRDNLSDAAGNDLEYYFAHFNGSSWQVSRLGYAGSPMGSGQPNYAGLVAVDPLDSNKVYVSANVDPATDAALAHYQIFEAVSPDGGTTWDWSQLTNTATTDNFRPTVVSGDGGTEALLWMQGTYASYTDYNTNIVGLFQTVPEPGGLCLAGLGCLGLLARRPRRTRASGA